MEELQTVIANSYIVKRKIRDTTEGTIYLGKMNNKMLEVKKDNS